MAPTRKDLIEYKHAPTTVCIPIHIPTDQGYYQDALPVLQLCLESLRASTKVVGGQEKKIDLMVLLQGCIPEVKQYVQNDIQPEFIIETPYNLGKVLSVKLMAMSAPGNYICFADPDTYFYPGWLEAQLTLLAEFPPAIVSGWVTRYQMQRLNIFTLEWAKADKEAKFSDGKLRSDIYEEEWARSVGRDIKSHLDIAGGLPDYLVEYKGLKAWCSNTHSQFMSNRALFWGILAKLESEHTMREIEKLDFQTDDSNVLRLSTYERVTRHIGNTPDQDLLEHARITYGVNVRAPLINTKRRHDTGIYPLLLRFEITRQWIFKLYNWIYREISV